MQPLTRPSCVGDGAVPPDTEFASDVAVVVGVTIPPAPPRCWLPASAAVPSGGVGSAYVVFVPGALYYVC